ncbi:sushi, von Willebrand factor type A, EGF and pentraxin domain-containing protein 1-like [Watersipora subatra]|uniref:sushi, von Willebrand factor type A, EGF and pentraxin domain-containing protein 1-like n=1 Tax=Watersipora subatra TaxID=2589382 RepID=UPI00355B25E2
MVGSEVVRCTEDGTWSTPPICHKVNCGPPPVVDNSKRQVYGHSYNDTVKYECDGGYEMIGDDTIICQETGYWTVHPGCKALTCDGPPKIENAKNFTLSHGMEVGSQAIYGCLPGYEMSGEPAINCQTNQQWSTHPRCQRVRCGNPPQIQNGVRRVYGHYLNDRTNYHCHTGYLMVGDESISCETNGHWTVPPECDVITCEIPPTPDNAGLVSITGTQFGQTATYQCLPGYTTGDPTYITCQLNGEWSRAPNCTLSSIVEGIRCGNPPQIQNGVRRVYGHYLNDRTKYSCHTGYLMVGDEFIYCETNGHWTVPPECDVVTCGMPPTPYNSGLVSLTGTQFGKSATYQCLPGYTTDDPTYITCQLNGEWSSAPNCTLSPIVEEK